MRAWKSSTSLTLLIQQFKDLEGSNRQQCGERPVGLLWRAGSRVRAGDLEDAALSFNKHFLSHHMQNAVLTAEKEECKSDIGPATRTGAQ